MFPDNTKHFENVKLAFQDFLTGASTYDRTPSAAYGAYVLKIEPFTKNETATFTRSYVTFDSSATATFVAFGIVNNQLVMATVRNNDVDWGIQSSEVPTAHMQTIATFQNGAVSWGLLPHDIMIV